MRGVYVVAEDAVTIEITRRLIKEYAPNLQIKAVFPVRGGKMKSQISNYNALSSIDPVVLLSDLDTEDCAPLAKNKLLNGVNPNRDFIINIAVDEAEAWLYADAEGLAPFLKVPVDSIPSSSLQKMGGMNGRLEVDVPIKTSLHLTSQLVLQSTDSSIRQQLQSEDNRCKGKEYNRGILPFIQFLWNPERARMNSYSLDGMIKRITALNAKFA